LQWGVKVPKEGFEQKCFYVWFDAPIGYVSITANYTAKWEQWWRNEDVDLFQFMGKDNVPFHTILFPGMLLATRDKWTKLSSISTTEYLNYEDRKFSKRNGIGIFGRDVASMPFPIEYWRYYLISVRPEGADTQFKWSDFMNKVNTDLSNNVGNLCHRVLSFVYAKANKQVPSFKEELMSALAY
jgi:methionyl-tRNA synthetase